MENTIGIGGLGPLSSPGISWAGHELRDGMALAVQHVNAAGGILGKSLAFIFEDTCGHTNAGLAAVEKLINDGIDAFAGEYHSLVANVFLDRIQESGLPFVCASCTLDAITERRLSSVFRLAPPQSYGWRIYADFLGVEGFRHVVALQEENQYWNSGSKAIELRLQELGVRFTRLSAAPGSVDPRWWIRQVQSIASYDPCPDMLLLLLSDENAVQVTMDEARSCGFVPPYCFFGDPAGRTGFPEWWQTAPAVSTKVPFLSYMRWSGLTRIGRRMIREFEKQHARQPTFVALEGYDSVLALARAFEEAGGADPESVCSALRRVAVEGTRGTINFSSEPNGVVHQQWKWPPVCVMAYDRAPRQFGEAELFWDSQLGLANAANRLRAPQRSFSSGG
jgi:ABC-type branched-subunit amino acid transport system substrate-binding protein